MLKTCLNTFGKDFGHFEKKSFSILLKFFQVSTLQGALGTFFSRKTSKQVQNLFGYFWKRVWVSWILGSFCISLKFFDFSTLQGALAKKFRKIHIKTCLDNLGNVFGHFWKFEFFSISVELFWVSRVHWAEFFSVEIIMQNMIKQCFWELFWRILKVSKFFHFFVFFANFDPPGCTGHFFSRKTSKQVQNLFGYFWKPVWVSWILGSFCISLKFFDFSTLQGALAKKFRKNHTKTCLDNLGNVFGQFWKFEFFSISVELFWVSRVHWAEKFSVEIIKQNMLKQCFWNVLGEFSTTQGALGKNFCRKITSKHVENMFEHFWERF